MEHSKTLYNHSSPVERPETKPSEYITPRSEPGSETVVPTVIRNALEANRAMTMTNNIPGQKASKRRRGRSGVLEDGNSNEMDG